jgi:hypothetical protein
MHARIAEVLDCLDAELTALRNAVDSVPAPLRQLRPAPDRWAVAEVLEHLAMVEASVMKACARQLASARDAGLGAETTAAPIRHTLPPDLVANRERRLTAPAHLAPCGVDAEAAWREIENVRARFREFIVTCDGLALADVSFAHPALGQLNMYQWFLFAAGHHARHAEQIREIAQQLP